MGNFSLRILFVEISFVFIMSPLVLATIVARCHCVCVQSVSAARHCNKRCDFRFSNIIINDDHRIWSVTQCIRRVRMRKMDEIQFRIHLWRSGDTENNDQRLIRANERNEHRRKIRRGKQQFRPIEFIDPAIRGLVRHH